MDRDWFDWLSLIFNTLATTGGLVGLFIGIRAYKIAKEQGRKTFELEILRELRSELNNVVDKELWTTKHPAIPELNTRVFSGLLALPREELPVWRMAGKSRQKDDDLSDIYTAPAVRRYVDTGTERDMRASIVYAMFDEIHDAMRKRIE